LLSHRLPLFCLNKPMAFVLYTYFADGKYCNGYQ